MVPPFKISFGGSPKFGQAVDSNQVGLIPLLGDGRRAFGGQRTLPAAAEELGFRFQ
jgi:hypothetical protein